MYNSIKHKKLWLVILIICIPTIIFLHMTYSRSISSSFSEHVQDQRKSSISKMVNISYNTIKPVINKVKTGEVEKSQARKIVSDMVRQMTYDDEFGLNYIFMSTYEGIMLVQPFEPYKEGTDQWNLKDADGNYIIRELVKAAREKPEGSFVSYQYYLPDNGRVEEKLSYVIGIPEIEAYIGTGMYVESSYYKLKKILSYQRYGDIALILFILIAAALYFRELANRNNMLTKEIIIRKKAEEELKSRYKELQNTKRELEAKHDELSAIYEELSATEEELRVQYEELQKSRDDVHAIAERYMLVAEGSRDVIWDWDSASNKIYISDRLREILGYSKDELNIKAYDDLYNIMHQEDTNKAHESHLIHMSDKTEYYSFDFRLKGKDGTYKWFQMRRKAVFNADGEIIRYAGSITDITEWKNHEAEIRKLAYFDYLTGLPNRVFLINNLQEKLSKCTSASCRGAVLFVDIDNFKYINDTFGHSYGDRVLVEVSNRMKSLCEDELAISRIGGDEFIIILDITKNEEQAVKLAQRVLEVFKEPISIDRNDFYIACSIGIALYPRHGSTEEVILKNADLAMYKAKNMGKNRYIIYDHNLGTELAERAETEKQLRYAFEKNEFELYYQPNYDIKRGSITGFEALIRWNNPLLGIIPPSKFISIAEEVGLINKIGKWVIDKSFEFAKTLINDDICISCNVSAIQLIQSNFVEDVIEAFDRYGLKRGCIALEITETSLIESFNETTEKLRKLRDKGILIYLDDFGTGYSSLTYLKELPIDMVKIDKSFIDDIISGGVETRIVRTIISLAHEIGLKVVAEGVEVVEQFEYLKECECDYIQGYLISKPVPEKVAGEFMGHGALENK